MPQFCILFYANFTILATQRGGMAQWPPLNTPLFILIFCFWFRKTSYTQMFVYLGHVRNALTGTMQSDRREQRRIVNVRKK